MAEPRASVVMTTLDARRHVEEAVRSVLAQTLPDWELVIVDGGSTDGTLEALGRLTDHRIRIHVRPGLGRPASLNEGFLLARAPIVAILDADDVALPRRLELQVAAMEADPSLVVVGSSQVPFIDDEGRPVDRIRLPQGDADLRRLLGRSYQFFHSSVAYRKSAWEAAGGFDERLRCFEDYDLWVRLAPQGRLANLPEELSLKRRHPAQSFHDRHTSNYGYRVRSRIMAYHFLRVRRDPRTLARAALFLGMSRRLHRLVWSAKRRERRNGRRRRA